MLYVYARAQDTDLNSYTSDTYAVITNLIINWQGRQLLSTATPTDLYELSVRNGLNLSYTEFSNHVGSPIRVQFGRDIGLNSLQAPSLLDRSTLSITATIANSNPASVNYVLYCIVIESGVASIIEGHVIRQTGILSQQDVLDSDAAPLVPDFTRSNVFGSSFFSDLLNGVKQGINGVVDLVPTGIKVFNTAKTLAPLLGLGMSGGKRHRSRSRGRKMYGRGLEGGDDENHQDEQCDEQPELKPDRTERHNQIRSEHHEHVRSERQRMSEQPKDANGGRLLSRTELLKRK